MAGKYWIKLYHEILHDRKMQRLRDRLWRRVIECFLMAGELDEGGFLPRLDDMAWDLRLEPEMLEADLMELAGVGILEQREGRWFVTKFAARQQTMSKAEYMRRLRKARGDAGETKQLTHGYQSVTDGNAELEIEIEKEKESGANAPAPRKKPAKDIPIPDSLKTPEFVEAWDRWKTYRREIGHPLKPTTQRAQLKKAAEHGPADSIWVMNLSIENGWQGLFFERLAERRQSNGRGQKIEAPQMIGTDW